MSARGDRDCRREAGVPGSEEAIREENAVVAGAHRPWMDKLTDEERRSLAKAAERGKRPDLAEALKRTREVSPEEKRQQRYEKGFRAHLATLSESERFKYRKLKITGPVKPDRTVDVSEVVADDTSEWAAGADDRVEDPDGLAGIEEFMARDEAVDRRRRPQAYEAERHRLELEAVCQVLPAVIDADNPRLTGSIIALAVPVTSGSPLPLGARMGLTAETLADRHGISLAAVQREVKTWRHRLAVHRDSLAWVRYILGPILEHQDPRLEAAIIASAASIGLGEGKSWRKQAEEHGILIQSWSLRVKRWVWRMGVTKPRDCKQNTDAYRFSNPTQLPTRLVA